VPGDIHNLGIEWHVPNTTELLLVDRLLDLFLKPEIERLGEFINGNDMERLVVHYQ